MGAIKMKVLVVFIFLCFCQISFSVQIYAANKFKKAALACEIGEPTITKSSNNVSTTFLFG